MAFSDMLTDTMDVYSASWDRAESGGAIRTETPKATGQKCRLETSGASQQAFNAALGIRVSGRIFTLYGECVDGDAIQVTGQAVTGRLRVVGTPIHRRAIGNQPGFYVIEFETIETGG